MQNYRVVYKTEEGSEFQILSGFTSIRSNAENQANTLVGEGIAVAASVLKFNGTPTPNDIANSFNVYQVTKEAN